MQYVLFAADENNALYSAPVRGGERRFLREHVLPTLRPLSEEDYMTGPVIILHALARFSYVLIGDVVLWCSEWDPGLIVVRMASDRSFSWAAFRSPNPDFGRRTPTSEDRELFDENAENHQYNLVFNAWDAHIDAEIRERDSFVPADAPTQKRFLAALEYANSLGPVMKARFKLPSASWSKRCKQNLKKWAGDGIRAS